MHTMHRIYCATPWELERERARFYDLVGRFNETAAMARKILFVPVSLVNVRDKRPMQYAVDENIRDSSHFLLAHEGDWGPPERNLRRDYALALESIGDPSSPMRFVAVLAKKQPAGAARAEGLPEPRAEFSTLDEFDACVDAFLAECLESATTP